MTQEDRNTLEAIIDRTNLEAVVSALSQICSEKEQHILENWQDKGLAKLWRKAELQLDRLANNLPFGLRGCPNCEGGGCTSCLPD